MPQNAVAWSEQYAIGIEEIDAQHRALLEILSKLNRTVHMDPGSKDMKHMMWEVFDELNEYAAYHFLSEEKLMQEHAPTDTATARHIGQHRNYWVTVAEFKQRYRDGDGKVAGELLGFLNTWWLGHILGTDKQMGAELGGKGVR